MSQTEEKTSADIGDDDETPKIEMIEVSPEYFMNVILPILQKAREQDKFEMDKYTDDSSTSNEKDSSSEDKESSEASSPSLSSTEPAEPGFEYASSVIVWRFV